MKCRRCPHRRSSPAQITHADAVNRTVTYDYNGTNALNSLLLENTGTGITP